MPLVRQASCDPGSRWSQIYLVVLGEMFCPPHSDPIIIGILEHLEVELPLGVKGLAAELVPKVDHEILLS